MKNYIYLAVVAILLIANTGCNSSSNSDKARIAQLEEQIEKLKSSQNSIQTQRNVSSKSYSATNIIEGTYEVLDNLGTKWIIILNSDETVNIHREGSNVVAYGSWRDGNYDGGIWLRMDEYPRIVFPNMEVGFSGHGDINGDYLYSEVNSAKSKNPNKRLPIKKIK